MVPKPDEECERIIVRVYLAACAGVLSGALTNTITIAAANNATTNRIRATVDSSGNRTAVIINVPV
jgi:uncharacterized transporter YbjL